MRLQQRRGEERRGARPGWTTHGVWLTKEVRSDNFHTVTLSLSLWELSQLEIFQNGNFTFLQISFFERQILNRRRGEERGQKLRRNYCSLWQPAKMKPGQIKGILFYFSAAENIGDWTFPLVSPHSFPVSSLGVELCGGAWCQPFPSPGLVPELSRLAW